MMGRTPTAGPTLILALTVTHGRSLMRMVSLVFLASFLTFPISAQARDPAFSLESYFVGKVQATGSFTAINGVSRRFSVVLFGRWNGKTLTLREDFNFSDGAKDTKTWRFRKTGPGEYAGSREDVVGTAPVRIDGRTARFSYVVYLDEARKNKVRFHDLMVLGDDGAVRNTALVTKYGFTMAWTNVKFRRSSR